MRRLQAMALVGCALLCAANQANADKIVSVDPAAPWQGFMNVSNTPQDPVSPNTYQFGQSWGTADLTAVFSGPVLTLGPNSVNDPSSYWYTPAGGPGATGNKIMDANMYVEIDDNSFAGQNVTFKGNVLSKTLIAPYTSVAFIKDFAPDFSSSVSTTIPLAPGQFSISLATNAGIGRHVQYGFETIGPDVWITDRGPVGQVQVTAAVPEPAIMTLAGLAGLCFTAIRRRR